MTRDDRTDPPAPPATAGPQNAMDVPGDTAGAVFASPWQARAFALVLHVHQQGRFTWPEWARYLGAAIAAARDAGLADDGSGYYEMWLSAAAKLFADKGMLSSGELAAKEEQVAANPVPPHGRAQIRPVAVDRGGEPPSSLKRA